MLTYISNNLATILVGLAILGAVVWVIAGMVKKKKSGKPIGCSCGCSQCPSASDCHRQ